MVRVLAACGFVLARMEDRAPRYLLLRNARHSGWGFPKGHADPGESELDTAKREALEETGISDITVVSGFEFRCEYPVKGAKRGDYLKQVVYFLGTTKAEAAKISDEHSRAGWYALEHALKLLPHETLRQCLRQANTKLA